MRNQSITINIYRMKVYDSILRRQFCIEFIDVMLNNKRLTDFTSFFSLDNSNK